MGLKKKRTDDDELFDLGPCCACEATGQTVRNVVMLHNRSPIPGHGWGCFVCGLPPDGASFVLCDTCFEAAVGPRFACRGFPGEDGRIPIEQLTEDFDHDYSKHPEVDTEPLF